MDKVNILSTLISVFVLHPIWFYLVWWLLKTNNAGELQFFLFWLYVPLNIFLGIVAGIISANNEKTIK
jgi:hypothetical protein